MIRVESSAEFEVMTEKLLIEAYALRDTPEWAQLARVLSAAAEIGQYLRKQDEMATLTAHQMLRW